MSEYPWNEKNNTLHGSAYLTIPLSSCDSKDIFKIAPCLMIILIMSDFVNHGMVRNTKTWIPWEQNITFLWNKKILILPLRWNILRSYCFVVEATFKSFFEIEIQLKKNFSSIFDWFVDKTLSIQMH